MRVSAVVAGRITGAIIVSREHRDCGQRGASAAASRARRIAMARGATIDGDITVTGGEPIVEFEEKRGPEQAALDRYNCPAASDTLEPCFGPIPSGRPPRQRARIPGKHAAGLRLGARPGAASFLELDVHLSADGVPMVIHDHAPEAHHRHARQRVRSARAQAARRSRWHETAALRRALPRHAHPAAHRCAGAARGPPGSRPCSSRSRRASLSALRPRPGGRHACSRPSSRRSSNAS